MRINGEDAQFFPKREAKHDQSISNAHSSNVNLAIVKAIYQNQKELDSMTINKTHYCKGSNSDQTQKSMAGEIRGSLLLRLFQKLPYQHVIRFLYEPTKRMTRLQNQQRRPEIVPHFQNRTAATT